MAKDLPFSKEEILWRREQNERQIEELLANIQKYEKEIQGSFSEKTKELGRDALRLTRGMLDLSLEMRSALNDYSFEAGIDDEMAAPDRTLQ